eukprot:g2236.t1
MSAEYFTPATEENGRRLHVSRTFFQTFFQLAEKYLASLKKIALLQKKTQKKHGGQNKIPEEDKKNLIGIIESAPHEYSHYVRQDSQNKTQYFEKGITRKSLWWEYCLHFDKKFANQCMRMGHLLTYHQNNIPPDSHYKHDVEKKKITPRIAYYTACTIINSFDVKFHKLRVDTCEDCERFSLKLAGSLSQVPHHEHHIRQYHNHYVGVDEHDHHHEEHVCNEEDVHCSSNMRVEKISYLQMLGGVLKRRSTVRRKLGRCLELLQPEHQALRLAFDVLRTPNDSDIVCAIQIQRWWKWHRPSWAEKIKRLERVVHQWLDVKLQCTSQDAMSAQQRISLRRRRAARRIEHRGRKRRTPKQPRRPAKRRKSRRREEPPDMREQHVHELMIERGEFTADHNEYYLFDEIDNCDRSADFYHGTSSPHTLCEVKTYKNKRYAIGQLLDYRRLLRSIDGRSWGWKDYAKEPLIIFALILKRKHGKGLNRFKGYWKILIGKNGFDAWGLTSLSLHLPN